MIKNKKAIFPLNEKFHFSGNRKKASAGLVWFFALIIIVLLLIVFIVSFSAMFVTKGKLFATEDNILLNDKSFYLSGLQGQRFLFYFFERPIASADMSMQDFIRSEDLSVLANQESLQKTASLLLMSTFRTSGFNRMPYFVVATGFNFGALSCEEEFEKIIGTTAISSIIFGEIKYTYYNTPYLLTPGNGLFGYGFNLPRLASKSSFALYYKYQNCEVSA
jgi:hypothetical protein